MIIVELFINVIYVDSHLSCCVYIGPSFQKFCDNVNMPFFRRKMESIQSILKEYKTVQLLIHDTMSMN